MKFGNGHSDSPDVFGDEALLPFELLPYHEAGHAVVAWCLGLAIREVSIKPNKKSLGRCYHSGRTKDCPDKHLLVALAGEAVADRIVPGRGQMGCKHDRIVACRCALMTTQRNKLAARQLIQKERDHVRTILAANWAAILDVASALNTQQRLTGRQATKIITQPMLNLSYPDSMQSPLRDS